MLPFLANSPVFKYTSIQSQAGLATYRSLPKGFRGASCGLNALLAATGRPATLIIEDIKRIARHNHLDYNFDGGLPALIMDDYLLALGYQCIFPEHKDFPTSMEEFLTRYPNSVALVKNFRAGDSDHVFAVREGIILDSWPVYKDLIFARATGGEYYFKSLYYQKSSPKNVSTNPVQLLGSRGLTPEERAHIEAIDASCKKTARRGAARRAFVQNLRKQLAQYKAQRFTHPHFEYYLNAKIGEGYYLLKNYEGAIQHGRLSLANSRKVKGLNNHPVLASVHHLLAETYFALKDQQQAEIHVDQGLAITVEARLLARKMLFLLNSRREREIISLGEKFAGRRRIEKGATKNDFITIYFSLGISYHLTKNWGQALENYDRVLTRYPGETNVSKMRARLLAEQDFPAELKPQDAADN